MTTIDRIEIDPDIASQAALEYVAEIAGSREKWRDENREAIEAYNEFVEKHGVFSDDVRQF